MRIKFLVFICVQFYFDGFIFGIGIEDFMIKIWDLKGRLNVVNFFGYQGFIISIVFLENGKVYLGLEIY